VLWSEADGASSHVELEKFEHVLASPIIAAQHVWALSHAEQSAPASPLLDPPDDEPLLEDPPLEDPPSVVPWVEPPPPDELLHATPAARAARPRRTHVRIACTYHSRRVVTRPHGRACDLRVSRRARRREAWTLQTPNSRGSLIDS
jgi:hypothetical protein